MHSVQRITLFVGVYVYRHTVYVPSECTWYMTCGIVYGMCTAHNTQRYCIAHRTKLCTMGHVYGVRYVAYVYNIEFVMGNVYKNIHIMHGSTIAALTVNTSMFHQFMLIYNHRETLQGTGQMKLLSRDE